MLAFWHDRRGIGAVGVGRPAIVAEVAFAHIDIEELRDTCDVERLQRLARINGELPAPFTFIASQQKQFGAKRGDIFGR